MSEMPEEEEASEALVVRATLNALRVAQDCPKKIYFFYTSKARGSVHGSGVRVRFDVGDGGRGGGVGGPGAGSMVWV